MKNYYYIIVDNENNPIDYYSDEYQYWIDLTRCGINECEVFDYNEYGLEYVNERLDYLNSKEVRYDDVKLPLKVVTIESTRNII